MVDQNGKYERSEWFRSEDRNLVLAKLNFWSQPYEAVLKVGELGQGYSSKCKVTITKVGECNRARRCRRRKASACACS